LVVGLAVLWSGCVAGQNCPCQGLVELLESLDLPLNRPPSGCPRRPCANEQTAPDGRRPDTPAPPHGWPDRGGDAAGRWHGPDGCSRVRLGAIPVRVRRTGTECAWRKASGLYRTDHFGETAEERRSHETHRRSVSGGIAGSHNPFRVCHRPARRVGVRRRRIPSPLRVSSLLLPRPIGLRGCDLGSTRAASGLLPAVTV